MDLKQQLKLSQQLVMTPQLQQAIKLLQLSRLEMVEAINKELEENPLLEEEMEEDFIAEEEPLQKAEEARPSEQPREITGEGDGRDDFDWDSYLEDFGPVGTVREKAEPEEGPTWDNVLTKAPTLTDHLLWQLRLSRLTEEEMTIGENIIGNLDGNGYLTCTVEEIAEQLGVEPKKVEEVLSKVQGFDPPGVAARDLRECLLIQARALEVHNTLVEEIIKNHLKDLETKNYPALAKKLKVSLDDLMHAVAIIGNMDPKPGSSYTDERVQSIVPDVYVIKIGDDYKVILNDDGLPRLRISNFYREIMAGLDGSKEGEVGKKYIKEKVKSAMWLIKSIQQRQKTILKVAESIVRFQKDFFDHGISHLKPLVLRDVALDVGMHESTISRVVTGKYMQTPAGLFEMKFFFSSGLPTSEGEAIASTSVKEEIKKLIAEENPLKPLSDSEIVKLLKKKGINIARRTVAKYREMMNILPSSRRKRYV
ncbi:MAG TPA: RNA polymerase factor sigma-54 [Syntrophales bacterium]|nr:RNA polymerase factor sigma-54 [Syntrophales bacterium]HOL59820.1 RNA polymerase factor sigma-54 [Syntrophales bacterium]HPO35962.1 RNA polymerase factor sigma-54 [Syntrophales bacterium]